VTPAQTLSDLRRKLGLAPGQRIGWLQVPLRLKRLLRRACPPGVRSAGNLKGKFDIVFYMPRSHAELAGRWRQLERCLQPDGAVWAITPRKPILAARNWDFTWEDVQRSALQTTLVDNKNSALTEDEYATRFVIRRRHRTKAGQTGHGIGDQGAG
jgi:hypothetical protein